MSSSSSSLSDVANSLEYMDGCDQHYSTEALPGALPVGQNTPQKCPYGLYAEQLSGTAFTQPRTLNRRVWLYRIRPTAGHDVFVESVHPHLVAEFGDDTTSKLDPNQKRWLPMRLPSSEENVDFVDGIRTFGGSGSATSKTGFAVHGYTCNRSMGKRVFCNSDGDLLIVPERGSLFIRSELGRMLVANGEICVIQRGIRFSVDLVDESNAARGYLCEIFGSHFRIPDLGPIGANGLANPRDFKTPVAWYEDLEEEHDLVQKFGGKIFLAKMDHSPFDVVAWHGNYAPFKYNLHSFNVINSVSYDHLDPSIFTVLTAPTLEPGVAACDFVIFPPRWSVQEHSFRPPYYHRNCMTEFMGLVEGIYEAKEKGFLPGGATLHSCMIPHGPERDVFLKAVDEELFPKRVAENSMAFMFESTYFMRLTPWALSAESNPDDEYFKCWKGLPNRFDPNDPTPR